MALPAACQRQQLVAGPAPQRQGAVRRPVPPSALRADSSSPMGARRRAQHPPGVVVEQRQNALGTSAAERAASSPSSLAGGSSSSSSSLVGSGSQQQRLRVAVDVDEVLGRFLHSLNAYCAEAHGMAYQESDYHVYDFAKIWRCSQDHSNNLVHEFFESHHFAAGIQVIPGAYDSLARLRPACDLMVVTSRQHCIQEPTLEWLHRHFPEIFSEVHFGNHFAKQGSSRKKSEICRAIGAEVLIDDNPNYAIECAEAGIHVLLYDWQHAYPWSKTADGPRHDRITRVRDWQEVEQVLSVLAAQQQQA